MLKASKKKYANQGGRISYTKMIQALKPVQNVDSQAKALGILAPNEVEIQAEKEYEHSVSSRPTSANIHRTIERRQSDHLYGPNKEDEKGEMLKELTMSPEQLQKFNSEQNFKQLEKRIKKRTSPMKDYHKSLFKRKAEKKEEKLVPEEPLTPPLDYLKLEQ